MSLECPIQTKTPTFVKRPTKREAKSTEKSYQRSIKPLLNYSKINVSKDPDIQQSLNASKRAFSYSKIADFGNYNKFLKMYKNKLEGKMLVRKSMIDSSTFTKMPAKFINPYKNPNRKFNLKMIDLRKLRERSSDKPQQTSLIVQNQNQ
mmetsp:Transcript_28542/g.28308  ORF Transcript_28542/g.28308 Transcript_28542/m.28308 type:complete len:149 (-) Transcript_28542:290-736(-)